MKKIEYFEGEAFDFFLKVLMSKRKGTELITDAVQNSIKEAYGVYCIKFDEKRLGEITPVNFSDNELKKQLKELYSYRSKNIQKLRGEILNKNAMSMCPCCTISSETSSMDHILPKEKLPEFAVNPLNLIPCCQICNSKKNDNWVEDETGTLIFLNLYQDDIPEERYLFVKLFIRENIPSAKFYIQNLSGIENSIYMRIESHYNRLKLCERFNDASITVFDELNSDILSNAGSPQGQIKDFLSRKAQYKLRKMGNNYWEGVLYEACSNNDEIIALLSNSQYCPVNG